MKPLITLLTALSLNFGLPSFAAHEHKCACDKKCQEACQSGKGEKTCKCTACDCAKTGKCGEGHCDKHEKTTGNETTTKK